ncbi:MAG TPA: DUF2975 domain-containing protein, partial [Verrucomicrobiae bacterium]|nr:DUF2975 domain-containing protein [Verrucomicrobiae bacterium]
RTPSPMATEPRTQRYRNGYSKLLRLYPKGYRERFGEPMEQTFNDLCHERVMAGRGLFGLALWVFVETLAGILREHTTIATRGIMNRGSTIFLRLVISLIAIGALTVCVFKLPRMISQEAAKTPETAWQIYLFLVGAYLQAAAFLFALFQGFKLLSYVDRNKAFSESSVRALRHIKHSAITIGLLMMAGIAWVLVLSAGTGDDSAGPVMIGIIGTFASSVVAAVAVVLQTLVQRAIDPKKEVS